MENAAETCDREEVIVTLRRELELRNREIARLHEVAASQAHAIAQAAQHCR